MRKKLFRIIDWYEVNVRRQSRICSHSHPFLYFSVWLWTMEIIWPRMRHRISDISFRMLQSRCRQLAAYVDKSVLDWCYDSDVQVAPVLLSTIVVVFSYCSCNFSCYSLILILTNVNSFQLALFQFWSRIR